MIAWRSGLVAIFGVILCSAAGVAAEETAEQALQRFTAAFQGLDVDKDKSLTLDEFLRGRQDVPVATRDYKMADADDNQRLALEEFLTVRVVVPRDLCGPLPDILTGLVDQIIQALDAACDNWDKDPQREMDARQFVSAIASQMGGSLVMRINTREVDPDQNNK
ncbi:MAG TPA: hypothetical protein VFG20_19110, partial [Planctomycetaceae bacterium]|nr:hypothetical protein [Planctomycetaceae bacterium]